MNPLYDGVVRQAGRLSKYQRDWLRFDAVAGLTTAAVVIPKSMAFASIAGLPVQTGLYVALVPMFVYALLGTSRPLSVSSTSTLAILTATELAIAVPGGDPGQLMAAASTLALLVGGILILAGILRLGFLANFISDRSSPASRRESAWSLWWIRCLNCWGCISKGAISFTMFFPP